MAPEHKLDPEIVRRVCRVYFERYKKPADLLDILEYLNAEKVPPPPGCDAWDFCNIVSVIDQAPKLCPEVMPGKAPAEGGTMTLKTDGGTYTGKILESSYGVSEDEFDVLELSGDSFCIAAKIPKRPVSDVVVKQKNISAIKGAELALYDHSPSFDKPFVNVAPFGRDKIARGFIRVQDAELFTDISELYGGSDIRLSGTIDIVCKGGRKFNGTFTVNTKFNW